MIDDTSKPSPQVPSKSPREPWTAPEHTLHRYYLWANRHRAHFATFRSERSTAPKDQHGRRLWLNAALAYVAYWFASLYVVVEGWKELRLSDPAVDKLLMSEYVDILRRFRNGVFHYQKDYFDGRLMDLVDNEEAIEWAVQLHSAFGDYFLRRFDELGASDMLDQLLEEVPELEKQVYVPRSKE